MTLPSKVIHVIPEERPLVEHLPHVLHAHACEGWEHVTAFPYDGAGRPGTDAMVPSLSPVTSTVCILKRLA